MGKRVEGRVRSFILSDSEFDFLHEAGRGNASMGLRAVINMAMASCRDPKEASKALYAKAARDRVELVIRRILNQHYIPMRPAEELAMCEGKVARSQLLRVSKLQADELNMVLKQMQMSGAVHAFDVFGKQLQEIVVNAPDLKAAI